MKLDGLHINVSRTLVRQIQRNGDGIWLMDISFQGGKKYRILLMPWLLPLRARVLNKSVTIVSVVDKIYSVFHFANVNGIVNIIQSNNILIIEMILQFNLYVD